MKYLKIFENFGENLTIDYLKNEFPIEIDTKYRKRYYININKIFY